MPFCAVNWCPRQVQFSKPVRASSRYGALNPRTSSVDPGLASIWSIPGLVHTSFRVSDRLPWVLWPAAPAVLDRVGTGQHPSTKGRLVLLGGVAGLAWAAGLRGFMAQVTPESTVHWAGTFGYILAPGLAVGVLLGWAEHLRRTGGRRGWRWHALAPLVFTAVLLSRPLEIGSAFADGIGGGALGIPIFALAGGYAMSGRGPVVARVICGIIAVTPVPIWIITVTSFAGPELAVTTPRGAWVALYFYTFLGLFMAASSIPHRATSDGERSAGAPRSMADADQREPGLDHREDVRARPRLV